MWHTGKSAGHGPQTGFWEVLAVSLAIAGTIVFNKLGNLLLVQNQPLMASNSLINARLRHGSASTSPR